MWAEISAKCDTDRAFPNWHLSMCIPRPQRQRLRVHSLGFSLIEVVVTMALISLALLGSLGLQLYALQTHQASRLRVQAVLLVSDLSERMEANKAAALALAYAHVCSGSAAAGPDACGPAGAACPPSALAAQDLRQWQAAVRDTLPQASCSVAVESAANPVRYSLSVGWIERKANSRYDAAALSTSGDGVVQTYRASRTIQD
jgi:type IV pilus assembly protein PilV